MGLKSRALSFQNATDFKSQSLIQSQNFQKFSLLFALKVLQPCASKIKLDMGESWRALNTLKLLQSMGAESTQEVFRTYPH